MENTGKKSPGRAERAELAVLRRENRRLQQDVDIPKRVTAFFVKETR